MSLEDRIYNSYGIVSGWYLFELADKACVEYLLKHRPDYKYWLTARVNGAEYLKQVCDNSCLEVSVSVEEEFLDNDILMNAKICSKDGKCFDVDIEYIGKNHLHCNTK